MRRLLALWLALLAPFWLARTALTALLSGRADTRFETLLLLVTLPLAQALLLAWATRRPGPPLALPLVQSLRLPALRILSVGDLLAVGAAAAFATGVAPGAPFALLLSLLTAAKLLAAAVAIALLGRTGGRRRGDHRLLVTVAATLVVLAATPLAVVGFERLPLHLPAGLTARSPLATRIVGQAVLLLVVFPLLFEMQSLFRRASAAATRALDWAGGLVLAAALTGLLGAVRGTPLAPAWEAGVRLLETVAATAMLAGTLLFRWALERVAARNRVAAEEKEEESEAAVEEDVEEAVEAKPSTARDPER